MKIKTVLICVSVALLPCEISLAADPHADADPALFQTSAHCMACHNNLRAPDGTDISIGTTWRASMMANSSRDPYWQAGVRREVTDHPAAQAAIEEKCSTCHMPMAHFTSNARGEPAEVFSNLASMRIDQREHLAADGVSCTVCHQVQPDNFGTEASFDGGLVFDTATPPEQRPIFGPHNVDAGRQRVMRSASSFVPTEATHLSSSSLCGSCHTLYTEALDDQGQVVGSLPEQMPFREWEESSYTANRSCQDCHMPMLPVDTPISSTLGQARPQFRQHVFRGGNAFMLSILNKYRDELGVVALPQELDAGIRRTREFLATETATVDIGGLRRSGNSVEFEVAVASQSGHKLPTAYPSRRVWLHVTVRDQSGAVLFESGALRDNGSIVGNANDDDATAYEPHYEEITAADQVQIYEPIMVDWRDRVTTGLIYAVRYVKDNRLLPMGFEKADAADDVAVRGTALGDDDFIAGGDRVRYRVPVSSRSGLTVEAELLFQSIGYRWADNLTRYSTAETDRFVRMYRDTIASGTARLAADSATIN